ncbi:MAG: SMI1/KNR4 family protein [Verrucomicrobiota bacterium]
MIEFHELSGPPSAQDIERLNQVFPEGIPREFRLFIEEHDGAYEPECLVDPMRIQKIPGGDLYGLQLYTIPEIFEAREIYEGRVSPDLVPVGFDSFGNQFCLGRMGLRYGKVIFWDHEDDVAGCLSIGIPTDADRIHKNEYPIADSFEVFLDLLILAE